MGLSGVTDRSAETRIDVRFVAQANSLGALADDVVAALIWADAKTAPLDQSEAIKRAAALFVKVAAEDSAPVGLWRRHEVSSALRRMTTAQNIAERATVPREASESAHHNYLQVIADALVAAQDDQASTDQIGLLRAYFEAIANTTIEAALASVHNRGPATAWLTI